jgi:hypothetical protein
MKQLFQCQDSNLNTLCTTFKICADCKVAASLWCKILRIRHITATFVRTDQALTRHDSSLGTHKPPPKHDLEVIWLCQERLPGAPHAQHNGVPFAPAQPASQFTTHPYPQRDSSIVHVAAWPTLSIRWIIWPSTPDSTMIAQESHNDEENT